MIMIQRRLDWAIKFNLRHDRRLGKKLLHSSLIFEHFDSYLLVAQYAQHYVTELALANALTQLQFRFGYDPTFIHKLFGVDAELLFAQFRQTFDELRAQTIRIGLIVLQPDRKRERGNINLTMYFIRTKDVTLINLLQPTVPDSQSIPHRLWSTYSPDT